MLFPLHKFNGKSGCLVAKVRPLSTCVLADMLVTNYVQNAHEILWCLHLNSSTRSSRNLN